MSQQISHTFKRGEFLFRSGQPVRGIYFLSEGSVKITQPFGDKEVIVRLAGVGDWVGHRSIFTSDHYIGSAQAKEKVRADFIPTAVVQELFHSDKVFALHLMRQIVGDLEKTERQLIEHQKLSVSSRLILLFRFLSKKFGQRIDDEHVISTPLTKVELSELVGASHEVVSRQLSKWKRDSLLKEEGKKILVTTRLLNRVIRSPETAFEL